MWHQGRDGRNHSKGEITHLARALSKQGPSCFALTDIPGCRSMSSLETNPLDSERLLHRVQRPHTVGQRPANGSETFTRDPVTREDIDTRSSGNCYPSTQLPFTQRPHTPPRRAFGLHPGTQNHKSSAQGYHVASDTEFLCSRAPCVIDAPCIFGSENEII